MIRRKLFATGLLGVTLAAVAAAFAAEPASYVEQVAATRPAAWWRFGESAGATTIDADSRTALGERGAGRPVAGVTLAEPGPTAKQGFTLMGDANTAARFDGQGARVEVADPGESSPFDFDDGDSITLEAWVDLHDIREGSIVYVVGKGRQVASATNQNWAMRLWSRGGVAQLSFVFHDRVADDADPTTHWHRWTADAGVKPDTGWHHLAIAYRFGEPDSVRGYIDGQAVAGSWDMGGPTKSPPIVDDAPVWIGSSMGGSPGSSFNGRLDEVAIYRTRLTAEQIAARFAFTGRRPVAELPPAPDAPADRVLVQIIEDMPNRTWNLAGHAPKVTDTYDAAAFGFPVTPRKYDGKALIVDRSTPYLVRAVSAITLPRGRHELLLRSLSAARLSIDGRVVAETPFMRKGTGAHEEVPPLEASVAPGARVLAAGHAERLVTVDLDGGPHVFTLESVIGGAGQRPELGELTVSVRGPDGEFALLSPASDRRISLNDADWPRYETAEQDRMRTLNAERRRAAQTAELAYWAKRHDAARAAIAELPPIAVPDVKHAAAVNNEIDRFILARLETEGIEPAALTDDFEFLRRVTLDTVGELPTPAEIEAYLADAPAERRARAIDRLLADPRWADHWVSYWQDVLAENPGILKPTLNNTGPFRWYLYEAMLDNRSIDRFATDLILMEGSTHYGGPAGFALATENDVPMAAKAHVIAQAFLGVELKCARCHDAPFHDYTQRDTFELAAMLRRGAEKVPMSSSIPLDEKTIARMIVEVTLKPGTSVKPAWPFDELSGEAPLPDGVIRRAGDTRELAAARVTWHGNQRFPRVLVNRLWARYLGFGLVSRVHDWQDLEPSHPELLDWLARQLVTHDYDLKHVARLILNSQTYQRRVTAGKSEPAREHEHLFAAPMRRRMTAEQVVDSLFAAAGKPLNCEMLTMDRDAREAVTTMQNLGTPRRAWQFASLSNERDRPSLAMPYAQSVLDVLSEFGWRQSRQNPIDCRDDTPTVQQPAILANGVATRRIVTLSDDSAFTALALEADSPRRFIEGVYARLMTRPPTAAELATFGELLAPGFDRRVIDAPRAAPHPMPQRAHSVSWSNHLSEEANRIKAEVESAARRGDPPSPRLDPDWRTRAEDMIWAIINDPRFVFVP